MIDHPNTIALVDELAAEIDRLKAEARCASERLEAAQAEIERLTELNDAMASVFRSMGLTDVVLNRNTLARATGESNE